MPIDKIEKSARLGIIGKIRLGTRVKTANGGERPNEVSHFVLHDAPGVEAVYGKEPTELDCFCISDDIHEVMPYWYKWYGGGVKDAEGNIIGGKLFCYGDGVTANYMAKRDPITRIVPTRECLAEKCPDWKNAAGWAQCRPSLSFFFMLPRVSLYGLFQMDTNSVTTINNFVSQLGTIHKQWGKLKGIPFKMIREPKNLSHIDKNGKEQSKIHYPVRITPNPEEFFRLYGKQMNEDVQRLLTNSTFAQKPQELLEESTQDVYAPTTEVQQALPPAGIETVAESPELAPLFEKLAALKNKTNTPKLRLITARQFESKPDPKAELVAYLNEQIGLANLVKTPPKPAVAANADGLI